jgi:hypothetical protein
VLAVCFLIYKIYLKCSKGINFLNLELDETQLKKIEMQLESQLEKIKEQENNLETLRALKPDDDEIENIGQRLRTHKILSQKGTQEIKEQLIKKKLESLKNQEVSDEIKGLIFLIFLIYI